MVEAEFPDRRASATALVIEAATIMWVFGRVMLFTALSLAMFLAAFLGYFTLPFFALGSILLFLGLRGVVGVGRRLLDRVLR